MKNQRHNHFNGLPIQRALSCEPKNKMGRPVGSKSKSTAVGRKALEIALVAINRKRRQQGLQPLPKSFTVVGHMAAKAFEIEMEAELKGMPVPREAMAIWKELLPYVERRAAPLTAEDMQGGEQDSLGY